MALRFLPTLIALALTAALSVPVVATAATPAHPGRTIVTKIKQADILINQMNKAVDDKDWGLVGGFAKIYIATIRDVSNLSKSGAVLDREEFAAALRMARTSIEQHLKAMRKVYPQVKDEEAKVGVFRAIAFAETAHTASTTALRRMGAAINPARTNDSGN
jgi:hypothetical protein